MEKGDGRLEFNREEDREEQITLKAFCKATRKTNNVQLPKI